jgi:purine-binding chemotaxis protein CheW
MTMQTLEHRGTAQDASATKQLIFHLSQESYALPVLKVREIIRVPDITPIPQMPAFILGVINLRGKIVPVVDVRLRFGMSATEMTPATCVVVAQVATPRGERIPAGLLVDEVEDVISIAASDIEETPKFGNFNSEFVTGMAKVKGRVVAMLEVDHLLLTDSLDKFNATIPLP